MYLPSQLERTLQLCAWWKIEWEGVGVHPHPPPLIFSIMMECTLEIDHCHSVCTLWLGPTDVLLSHTFEIAAIPIFNSSASNLHFVNKRGLLYIWILLTIYADMQHATILAICERPHLQNTTPLLVDRDRFEVVPDGVEEWATILLLETLPQDDTINRRNITALTHSSYSIRYHIKFYVPEAYIVYFIRRCKFLYCSEQKGCTGGEGEVAVSKVT